MELNTYCDNLSTELDNWEHQFDEITRKIDIEDNGSESRIVSYLNDLHTIRKELGDRIRRLKTECPPSWDSDKLESQFATLKSRWEDIWHRVSSRHVGG